jgi:DNA-directed RNA polymerase specialized sigma24 family protein
VRTDAELLAKGDAEAFAEFYRRHVRRIAGYLTRAAGDPEVGADLTAETFAAALAGAKRNQPERAAPATWLFGIAANKLSEWRRRGHAACAVTSTSRPSSPIRSRAGA